MRKWVGLAAAFALAVTMSAADAADMALKAPPPPPTPVLSWSGFYVGGEIGGAWGQVDWRNATPLPGGTSFNFPASGLIGGGFIGAQAQLPNNLVLGVEGTFDATDLKHSIFDAPFNIYTTNVRSIATVDGKLGYAVGTWLPYVKGGWAWADVNNHLFGVITGDTFDQSKTLSGWNLAVGIDYMVVPNWIVGVEYNHYDFGTKHCVCTTAQGTPVVFDENAKADSVMARLSFKFGAWGTAPAVVKR